jgi:hypothetical protein
VGRRTWVLGCLGAWVLGRLSAGAALQHTCFPLLSLLRLLPVSLCSAASTRALIHPVQALSSMSLRTRVHRQNTHTLYLVHLSVQSPSAVQHIRAITPSEKLDSRRAKDKDKGQKVYQDFSDWS